MAVAFRSIGTLNRSTSGVSSAAVATPAGFAAGDLLLCVAGIANFSGTGVVFPTTVPSGWSTLNTTTTPATVGTAIYYKIATGSEGSTQTWSGFSTSGASFWHSIFQMAAFTGCDTTTPIITSGTAEWGVTTNTTTTAAQTHPSKTPTTAGSGVLLYRVQYQSSGTSRTFTSSITSAGAPAGVERADPTGSCDAQFSVYTRDGGFALAAQSYTTTASSTGSGGQHMWTVILNAAAGGGGPTLGDSVGILLG